MRSNSGYKSNIAYKNILTFILSYLHKERVIASSTAVLIVLSVAVSSSTPIYVGKIIDSMAENIEKTETLVANIWHYFAILIILKIVSEILRILGNQLMQFTATKIENEINQELIWKVQRFSSHWHESNFAGATARKITRTASSFFDVYWNFITMLVPAITVIVVTEAILIIKLPQVALIFFVLIIFYIVLSGFLSIKIIRPKFKIAVEKDVVFSAYINDIMAGMPIIKSFATEEMEDHSATKILHEVRDSTYNAFKTASFMNMIRNVVEALIYGSIVATSIWLWNQGRATPGDIALIVSSAAIVSGHLSGIGNFAANTQKHISYISEGVELWMRDEEVQDKPEAADLVVSDTPREDKIFYDNITFQYPNTAHYLFGGLSLKIAHGEKIALVGTSGSGKSSFIKLMQRLYNLQGGTIYIEGQNIADVTIKSLRRAISLVPQDPILFHRSLKENISYGKPNATMEEIIEAAKKARIHYFIAGLKDGYDTEVGERGLKLSGGERQRVAIARAILADRPILVLDEATSSLDSVSEYYVKEAMKELMKGRTAITVAHRLSTIKNSDRILVFDQGKIIEQGSHDELIKNPESNYSKLYNMQSLGILVNE